MGVKQATKVLIATCSALAVFKFSVSKFITTELKKNR